MSATSTDTYRSALEAIERIVNREAEANEVLRKVVALLADRFAHYSWIGIYCGAAAASGRTEILDDVNADERYLACFVSTRSEIVIPICSRERWWERSTSTPTNRLHSFPPLP